jgi:hypothetical protein
MIPFNGMQLQMQEKNALAKKFWVLRARRFSVTAIHMPS